LRLTGGNLDGNVLLYCKPALDRDGHEAFSTFRCKAEYGCRQIKRAASTAMERYLGGF
jgi:hypothetical protein